MRAALEMHASLEKMNPQILERHGVRLSMRVGVNTGDVIAGAGGDQLMITGDVVNDLLAISEEPNVRIFESKGLTCNVTKALSS